MMNEPPIDELTKIAGNKYVLTVLAAKRAKEIETTRRDELKASEKKSISVALDEIYDGEIVANNREDE